MKSMIGLCFIFSLSVLNVFNTPIPIEILRVIKDDPTTIDCFDTNGRKNKMLLVKIENDANISMTIENDLTKLRFQNIIEDTLFLSTNPTVFYGCLLRTYSNILKRCFKLKVYEKIDISNPLVMVQSRSSILVDFTEQITDDIRQYRWAIGDRDDYDWDGDSGIMRIDNKLWIDSFGCDRIGVYAFLKGDWVYPYFQIYITIKDFTSEITTTSTKVFYRDALRAILKINYDRPITVQVFKVEATRQKMITDLSPLTQKGLNYFEFIIPSVSYSDGGKYFFGIKCSEKNAKSENLIANYFIVDVYTLYETHNAKVPLRHGENVALKFNVTEPFHNGQNVRLENITGAISPNMVVEKNMVWIDYANCENAGKITALYTDKRISREFDLVCPPKFESFTSENEDINITNTEDGENLFNWSKIAFLRKVNIHQPFNMRCAVSHSGINSLKLLKITKTSQKEIMGKVFSTEKNIDGNKIRTLTMKYDIPSIMFEHIGTYRCIAEAQSGAILVQDKKDFHIILSTPLNYTLTRGQRLNIDCGIFHIDDAEYEWTLQNKDKEVVEWIHTPVITLVASFGTPKGPYKCFLHEYRGARYQVLSIKLFTSVILPDDMGTKNYLTESEQPVLINFSRFGTGNFQRIFHFQTQNSKPRVIKLGEDQTHKIQSFQCKDIGVYQTSKSPHDKKGKSISLNFNVKISLEIQNFKNSGYLSHERKKIMIKDPDDSEDSLIISCSVRGSLPSKVNKSLVILRNGDLYQKSNETELKIRERYSTESDTELWHCMLMVYCKNEEILVTEKRDSFYAYTKHDFNNDILIYEQGRNYAIKPTPQYANYYRSIKWTSNIHENISKQFEKNGILFLPYMSDLMDGVCLKEQLSGERIILMMKHVETEGVEANIENGVLELEPGESKRLTCKTSQKYSFLKRLERQINVKDWTPLAYGIEQDIFELCQTSSTMLQQSELSYEITEFRSDYAGYYRCVFYDISRGFHQEMYEEFEVRMKIEQRNGDDPREKKKEDLTYTLLKTEELWIEPEEERLVLRGKPTFFTCLAIGDVKNMKVLKDNTHVVSMNMTKGLDEIFRITMQIPQVSNQHYGSYTCVAEINVNNENVLLEKSFNIISK